MKEPQAALKNRYSVVARFHGDMTKLPLRVQDMLLSREKHGIGLKGGCIRRISSYSCGLYE
jgi:hypothetical protein